MLFHHFQVTLYNNTIGGSYQVDCSLASAGYVDAGGAVLWVRVGVAGSSAFLPGPAPMVKATRSRTDRSKPSQPDGGLRNTNTT